MIGRQFEKLCRGFPELALTACPYDLMMIGLGPKVFVGGVQIN